MSEFAGIGGDFVELTTWQPPSELVRTPEWVRDAVFYQIFPDRFARSLSVAKPSGLDAWGAPPTWHGYQGGDLIGIAERLDYLKDLGVNAIYMTPIFQSASNHRYHTHDYEKVDPMLGGDAALRKLLDDAHARGFKVVLDGVFNHASRGFFQFHDILENGPQSAYLDWFYVKDFPLYAYDTQRPPNYGAWWNLHALPKFNVAAPAAREFLLGIARRWIDFGIDGWRLDVPNEIDDDDFWRAFRHRVREGNPQAYIVGEVWGDAARWLGGDMWDGVMNYQFTRSCIAFFIGERLDVAEIARTTLNPPASPSAEAFAQSIQALLGRYSGEATFAMLNLLGSHDIARFITLARGDAPALRLATLFQMTYPGAPSLYYGDEIGMRGGHDPQNRGAFPWDRSEWDVDLLHYVQRLIALRRSRACLRGGSYTIVHARGNVFAHWRALGDDFALVVFNVGSTRESVSFSVPGVNSGVLRHTASAETVEIVNGMISELRIGPRSGMAFLSAIRGEGT